MTPLQHYQNLLSQQAIRSDPQQLQIIQALEHIYHAVILRLQQRQQPINKLWRRFKSPRPIHGLYVWGKVGTGKTFLLDTFYNALPSGKLRMHFHVFMQDIHQRLNALQGQKDPLTQIAQDIAANTVVICFDEFIVTNIADAMILGELFRALFAEGVCLIATSNTAPDDLYKNGLQRQRFLPAIELIKKNTEVFHVTTETDYRLRHLDQAGVYYTPLDAQAAQQMQEAFLAMAGAHEISEQPIELLGRNVPIIKRTDKTLWMEFSALCGRPRSQRDYLELSHHYDTVMISNIPVIKPAQIDLIVSFIHLIDVFYDAHVRIIVSAATEPAGIYPEGTMAVDFRRTCSRLIEMQSVEYFHSTNDLN